MNRWLQYVNLFGVLALAALCVFQWRMNRQLNLEVNRLEKNGISRTAKIDDQSKKLKGTTDDLETFREQLARATVNLKEEKARSTGNEAKLEALTAERDKLKDSLAQWTNAVAARDKRLAESDVEIKKLANDLNAAVGKYNQLASNYNTVVNDLNAARTQAGSTNK